MTLPNAVLNLDQLDALTVDDFDNIEIVNIIASVISDEQVQKLIWLKKLKSAFILTNTENYDLMDVFANYYVLYSIVSIKYTTKYIHTSHHLTEDSKCLNIPELYNCIHIEYESSCSNCALKQNKDTLETVFIQNVEFVDTLENLPPTLKYLYLGINNNEILTNLPPTLQKLTIYNRNSSNDMNFVISNLVLPENCNLEVLDIKN